jgi:hypothetical protein
MSDPDDGVDEGPRGPTGRVSMGQGKTDPGAGDPNFGGGGDPGDPDVGGDFGGEGIPRNSGIASYLQAYTDGVDSDGWGDGSSENAPLRPQIDVVINLPPSADEEGWGNFNNPRAVTGLTQLMVVAAARAVKNTMERGVMQALAANASIHVQAAGAMGEAGI